MLISKVTKNKIKLLIYLICLPVLLMAQEESPAVKKRKKQLEKQEQEKVQKSEEARKEALERHMNIQTKEVRKRMKKNQKKSKRINDNRQKFFILRWFD